jgi:pimeloyl-ACP methyl ester carboxylesterase
MPRVDVEGLAINYDVQGGEPLLLIPYTSADHVRWAFQLPAYTEHFSCIAIDLPGSGESDKPAGPYSTDGYADQVAAFLDAIGIERAHVAGMSLGAAVGIHLAARHPGRVRSLSVHSGWEASDDYLKIVLEQWRTLASALPTIADVVIQAIFPWCFTPEAYVERPEFVETLVDFVRGRPPAGGRLRGPDRRGRRPRRERGTGRDRRPDPDHLRRARPRLRQAVRRAAHERDRRERAGRLRPPVARRASRGPRDLQPRDARLPAAPTLVTPMTARRPMLAVPAGAGV